MKNGLVFLLLAVSLVNCCRDNKIVLKTRSDQRVYNFFPLECSVLDFLVKATNDVHVVLTQYPVFVPPYYEIVFGGWGNSKTVIRKDSDLIQTQALGQHVKRDQFGHFWVRANDSAKTITAGVEPGTVLVNFTDSLYIPMKYFGISTGFGSEGVWQFSTDNICCDRKDDKSNLL